MANAPGVGSEVTTGPREAVQHPEREDTPSLLGLQKLIDRMSAPVLVVDLSARRVSAANEPAAELLGAGWPVAQELFQRELVDFVEEPEARRIGEALDALERGAIRSYEGDRSYLDLRGRPVHAHHSVSRVNLCDAPPVAVAVITPQEGPESSGAARAGDVAPALAVLGHDWRFDDVSPQAEATLGISPTDLAGTPLLAAVQPDDATEVLITLARSLEEGPLSTTVRFRTTEEWRGLELTIGPLCRHRPPQLALLLAPARGAPAGRKEEQARLHALERHVSRIAREIEATGVGIFQPVHVQPNPMPDMSLQQQEVVTRLLRGEGVGQMAEAMHLSRSTVRNHLSAIYRKLGVHSQAELIAHLTGRRAEPEQR